MEFKTLWLGLVLSLAAFAVKTGLGWAYLWRSGRPHKRLAASLGVFTLYAALFVVVGWLVSRINILAHYETLSPLWRNGVILHWLTALMLFVWGLILLRKGNDECCSTSRGWLALVIPCPVCLSVVLMSTAALALYFPEQAASATAALFAAFMLIAVLGGSALLLKTRPGQAPAEHSLGLAMLVMAAYFMLSALIAPQFAELGRVYRIAAYAADGQHTPIIPKLLTVAAIAATLGVGYFVARQRIVRQK